MLWKTYVILYPCCVTHNLHIYQGFHKFSLIAIAYWNLLKSIQADISCGSATDLTPTFEIVILLHVKLFIKIK